jgi:nicotinamide-nucleotide amidase
MRHADAVLTDELTLLARRAADLLRERGETVSVAEGSAGGLVSASLLSVPGASAYYAGGAVVYTMAASRAFMAGPIEVPPGMRGATEPFATYLAQSVAARLTTTWGLSEAGAAGPPNRYGDPAGHAWVAVAGPAMATRHVSTGSDDRGANMVAFAAAALTLLVETLSAPR